MSSLDLQNPETRPPAYHRKEKSLGLLCSNFLRLYSEEGVATFELDDAASKLGVERRRMYDVVNILESIRIIAKKGKNQYSWKGFGEVPRALEELKEDGMREKSNHSDFCNPVKVSKNIENGVPSSLQNNWEARSTASLRRDNRRDKSLVILTQSFIKLFLCSDMDFILLDDAAQALLGDNHDTTALRTKVRRLYDIANVFSSMNMIEKTHFPESRKPAFRWLGWKEKRENGSDTPSDLNESKKRLFGIDITNDISKRNRVESSTNCINQTAIDVPMHNRHGDLRIVHDGIKLKQRSKHSSKGIEFGPFAPVNVSGLKDPERRRVIEFQENLTSTYRPQ
ncbi:E2F transcription factor-like E2FF isoform X1 [Juglans microcarpa x Juglans regia]|uniref:E2F transcription factor-like E2FF isoform X1 n=1 Tax=Juglans microcarpa x Juglans regia TaxID=2249226 RepID=UPI001B7F6C81|nr:E2F transcription factor-like E2FF isoform X1 [Juglans microcarpa x Juglans regia]